VHGPRDQQRAAANPESLWDENRPGCDHNPRPNAYSTSKPPNHSVTAGAKNQYPQVSPPVTAIHALREKFPARKPRNRCDQFVKRFVKE